MVSGKLSFVQEPGAAPRANISSVTPVRAWGRAAPCRPNHVPQPAPRAIIIIFVTRLGRDFVMLVPVHALGLNLSNMARQIKMLSYSFRC